MPGKPAIGAFAYAELAELSAELKDTSVSTPGARPGKETF